MTQKMLTPRRSAHRLLLDAPNSEVGSSLLTPSNSGAPNVISTQQDSQLESGIFIDFANLNLSDSVSQNTSRQATPATVNNASPIPRLSQFNGADEPLPPDRNTTASPSGVSERMGHARLHSADSGAGARPHVSPQAQRPRSHSALPPRRQASPSPGHIVENEQPPDTGFYKPACQQALRDSQSLMSSLAAVLGSDELHLEEGAATQKLYHKAKELAAFRPLPKRIVAFVGDSGVGKSSVLNSLLDCDNLARSSDGGAACTCVATEYRYHDSNQFRLEAETFNEQELHTRLRELVGAYRSYETLQADLGDDEKVEAMEQRKGAEQTLNAMFAGRFTSLNSFLQNPGGSVVEEMMTWARDSLERLRNMGTEQSFDRADQCSERLTGLTSEQLGAEGDDDFLLWPYIKKVRVYLKAHVLSQGLILVDLPGLRDLSATRRDATERYLLQCDDIMVVCHRDRATSDAGVKSIFQLAEKAKLSSVGIICTKSDHNNAQEAKRDWKGAKAREIGNRIDAVDAAKQALANVESRIAELQEVGDDDLVEEETSELLRLVRESAFLRGSVANHESELSRYISTIRNHEVVSKLKETYEQHGPEGEVDVFCVSNQYYRKGRNPSTPGHRVDASFWLNLSGILALRKHCLGLIANSQHRLARRYIEVDIPHLVSTIQLWLQAGSGTLGHEQKRAIGETVDAINEKLHKMNRGCLSRIARELDNKFNQLPLRDGHRLRIWSKGAHSASQRWHVWHFQTYAAFCRNYGRYATQATGWVYHDWNEEAMTDMIQDLQQPWGSLVEGIDEVYKIKTEEVQSVLEEALALLADLSSETGDLLSGSIEAMEEVIERCQDHLMDVLEDLKLAFDKELGLLHTDTLSSISTSIFCTEMKKTYNTAIDESGSGSDVRRKRIIETYLGEETVFRNLRTELKSRFKQLTAQLQSDMRQAAVAHIKEVQDTLNLVREDNIDTENERDAEFRERVGRKMEDVAVEIKRIQCMAVGNLRVH